MEIFQTSSIIFLLIAFSATTSLTLYISFRALLKARESKKTSESTYSGLERFETAFYKMQEHQSKQEKINKVVLKNLKNTNPVGSYCFDLVNDSENEMSFIIGGGQLDRKILFDIYGKPLIFGDSQNHTAYFSNVSEYLGKSKANFTLKFISNPILEKGDATYRSISAHPNGFIMTSSVLDVMEYFSSMQFQAGVVQVENMDGPNFEVNEYCATIITLAPNVKTTVCIGVVDPFNPII